MTDCCNHNCNEGRTCPERIRRQQETEYLWTRALGVEAADAPRVTGAVPPIVTTELRPVREPWSGEAKLLIVAVTLTWLMVLYLSVADPRDLSSFWPRVLAALSF